MNSLYFFLPFILITSVGIYQDSFADEIVTGYDYFDTTKPDGSHVWSSHHPYILNQQGQYVPFLNDGNKVETNHGSVILNADGSYSFYKKGIIDDTPLFTDKIIAKYADVSNLNSWTYPSSINNDTPDVSWDGDNFVSTKQGVIGKMEYKYVLSNGVWKTQLEATNLSGLTTKAFGFDQIIDLNRDVIFFGGQQRNLDNFDGTTFDKAWLEDNQGKVVNFLNDISFDFDLGFENLYSITIHDTGVGTSQLVFDYRTDTPLLPNETLIIDPTFSSTTGTLFQLPVTGLADTACNTTLGTKSSGASTSNAPYFRPSGDATNDSCVYVAYQTDISGIPNNAIILDVDFETDIADTPGWGNNAGYTCDYFEVTTDLTGTYDASMLADVKGGTKYIDGGSDCHKSPATNNVSVDLGANANSKLQQRLATDDLFAFSVVWNPQTRGANNVVSGGWSNTELTVVYTIAPNPPTSLSCSGIPFGYFCSWTPNNPSNVTGYWIQHSPNNSTWAMSNRTLTANVTSTSYYNGFGIAQYNYIRVNATNIDGGNSTSSNVIYQRTDNIPDAPSIIATPVSATQIDVVRTAGASNGGDVIDDYSLRASINGGGWTTLVSNSTIANFYNHTGVDWFDNYIVYQWRDGNDVGWSSYSANSTAIISPPNTYSGLAPTNLKVYPDPPSPSKLDLEWIAPAMQNLNGYRIYREAPIGGGFSIIALNTSNANAYYNNTGLSVNTYYNYKVYALNSTGISGGSNTYSQTTYHLPDAVDDLTVTANDLVGFDLDWTQPNTLYGYLLGYNINYTTPEGLPLTVYIASTGDSDTDYEITGTSGSNEYSFRVSAITIHGKNVTGANIANGTAFDAFAIGTLDISEEGEDQRPITFAIHQIDSDTSDVVVTYDPALQLACDFRYALAGSNTTYTGLTENVNGALVYSNFTINGINNDIIDIDCWDELDTTTRGQERIGQSTIPIVEQVNSFQDGLFGTSGKFGAFDMMTIIIIIISMIGFNRSHPYVGVIVMFAVIGFARHYNFIQDITVVSGLIILVVALAIAYGRRDNEA